MSYVRLVIDEQSSKDISLRDPELAHLINLLNEGEIKDVQKEIEKISERNDLDYSFFSSMVSFPSETEEQFNARHISMLKWLAEQDYAGALYALGVYSDSGELLDLNPKLADDLIEKAAKLGHVRASYLTGLLYFFGIKERTKDRTKGIDYIRFASSHGCEDALEFMRKLKESSP